MTGPLLVFQLSQKLKIPREQAELVLRTMIEIIVDALSNEDCIHLHGIGFLKAKFREAYTYRRKSGEEFNVAAGFRLFMRPHAKLLAALEAKRQSQVRRKQHTEL